MTLWFYSFYSRKPLLWDGWLVLFDGENTYWHDGMMPSSGYEKLKTKKKYETQCGTFFYIGEF